MNYMWNGKVMIIHLIVGLMKKILLYKMSYFPESALTNKIKIKFDLDLSNYAARLKKRSRYD